MESKRRQKKKSGGTLAVIMSKKPVTATEAQQYRLMEESHWTTMILSNHQILEFH